MYHLGIDLGGTNIVAGVIDDSYKIIAKAELKTAAPRPEADICDTMADAAKKALAKAGISIDEVSYVGIGVPGAVDKSTGIIEYSSNLGFHNWEIVKMMNERLNKPVYIENDANCAAYGEYLAGSAKGTENAIAITLGTGVGGGIIINGKIYSGSNFAGAEIGHMVIVRNGRSCPCGRKGCFEAYASATGLINLTKDAVKQENPKNSYILKSLNGNLDKINGATAFNAMRAGDKVGASVVKDYISYLACGVTNIINIFQPDILCIGGGISHEGNYLLKPLINIIEKERYTKHNDKQTKICIASLGNDAGLMGAAFLEN